LEKPERVVEAALFSAGRPVSIEEIGEATGLDPETIRTTIRKLIRSSRNRDTSLEVVKAGAKYAMQLKKELVPAAAKLAQMDIPRRLLKTLALIAYHQPVKQSEVLEMVGQKVYDHVHELHKLGLILESPVGQTKILTTSSRFPEYFGIKTTKREDIKKWMAERVGIKVDGTSVGAQPAPEILADKTAPPVTGEAAMNKEAPSVLEEAGPAEEASDARGEEKGELLGEGGEKGPVKKDGKGPNEEE
jgi:segregation and condensation protein B